MKKLHLVLTNPCSENWNEMQPAKAGRFCDQCTKHIIDLTAKTDTELIDFFKNKKANVCGRLLSTQLNRELTVPRQRPNWYWLMPIALGVSIFSPLKSLGFTPIISQNGNNPLPRNSSSQQSNLVEDPIVDIVKGKVVDVNIGKPLVGVKIKYKNFNNVVALTDSSGNFTLSVAEEDKTNILLFEAAGYDKKEMSITADMVVKMKEIVIMLGGISSISTTKEPLYVIYYGNKSCVANANQVKSINPNWIEKLDILKDASATALYGSKAANGVILMGIKKEFKNKIDFSKKD
ncbi:hypothetical protein FA048_08535 [Pedobacter polaris]|uniref:Uncharacterized protein n=1 Tax=Pedobacter polaris TaxID=2571273 RepID=A0A4U1CRF0_9SPHI|nr:carboxypeptidase-like regulatory domain-containing protein [Pedobacter polaris]TKC10233.1 hypothetical protein FA048_08535 [Pedobacter polaris]